MRATHLVMLGCLPRARSCGAEQHEHGAPQAACDRSFRDLVQHGSLEGLRTAALRCCTRLVLAAIEAFNGVLKATRLPRWQLGNRDELVGNPFGGFRSPQAIQVAAAIERQSVWSEDRS